MNSSKHVPLLRFPEFVGDWEEKKIADIVDKISNPVKVIDDELYTQIGIRSHCKGIFHKPPVSGKSLGAKRVFWLKEDLLVLNIVFAWEQAVAKTGKDEIGLIASHRFPMYKPKEGVADLDFLLYLFHTKKGKHYLELASPGGAGRNKTLGQKEFERIKVLTPTIEEQKRIATTIETVDVKIEQLKRKKELLEQYKKGVMQQIFTQEIRFKDEDGSDYPEWEEKTLGEIASFSRGKGISKSDIDEHGNYPCIRYGELYTYYGEIIDEVRSRTDVAPEGNVVSCKNDVIIPSSGETSVDIAKASCVLLDDVILGGDLNIIRSSLNGVFLSYYLNCQKKYEIASLAQGNSVVHLYSHQLKSLAISYPVEQEQLKIAQFLREIDSKVSFVQNQLKHITDFKKGLLQQMFI